MVYNVLHLLLNSKTSCRTRWNISGEITVHFLIIHCFKTLILFGDVV